MANHYPSVLDLLGVTSSHRIKFPGLLHRTPLAGLPVPGEFVWGQKFWRPSHFNERQSRDRNFSRLLLIPFRGFVAHYSVRHQTFLGTLRSNNADVVKYAVAAWGLCRGRRVRGGKNKLRWRDSATRLLTDRIKRVAKLFYFRTNRNRL